MNFILDTNLVLIYLRDNELSRRIEQDLKLLSGEHNLIISVVSVGELKSIAKQNKWGSRKVENMVNTLSDFLIADLNTEEILERYADIDAFSQGKLDGKNTNFSARNMGKNDLWIAATASVYDLELLTTDNDFQHLKDDFLKLRIISLGEYD
ncbi:MAG: PIN domain-containing protein [Bacteroidetes bacterium]|nr:PIN domain-containing protein [Bacteroidota bacterium]MCB0855144.1 PIN domain-containing protein [Bacteroidota bacterium]